MKKSVLCVLICSLAVCLNACSPSPEEENWVKGAGFRYSTYGPVYDPGAEYWAQVAQEMAANFPDTQPQGVWIVGELSGNGTDLNFPVETDNPFIQDGRYDDNEAALTLFDDLGIYVWLQIEPGNAPVEELIHHVISRYRQHPAVLGVGIDVEWYQSSEYPEGKAVTDAEAQAWVKAVRSYGSDYRIFLKHWLVEKMPPTQRDGIVFVDDSQGFASLTEMVTEFEAWGQAFTPAPVAFQFGYPSDQAWWSELDNPPGEIGACLWTQVPNAEALYWVDFTVLEVFPPGE
jgi:hypothetical protein